MRFSKRSKRLTLLQNYMHSIKTEPYRNVYGGSVCGWKHVRRCQGLETLMFVEENSSASWLEMAPFYVGVLYGIGEMKH